MTIAIRPATGGDVAAIDALPRRSFPAADEALLVQRLCIDGDAARGRAEHAAAFALLGQDMEAQA